MLGFTVGIKDSGFHQNCIIVGDFNTTMHVQEKRGGSIVRDPSREIMEDMVSSLDRLDVYPNKGKYTWSNQRSGKGHILLGWIYSSSIAFFVPSH
jgi:hypothetical protein